MKKYKVWIDYCPLGEEEAENEEQVKDNILDFLQDNISFLEDSIMMLEIEDNSKKLNE
jgi:hypothetical protein